VTGFRRFDVKRAFVESEETCLGAAHSRTRGCTFVQPSISMQSWWFRFCWIAMPMSAPSTSPPVDEATRRGEPEA